MKFLLMLYEEERDWAAAPAGELRAALAEHEKFARYLAERGVPFSGEALGTSRTARTLRPAADGMVVTDGPYVELKEHIGGFYLIEAADMDEAVEIARYCPIGSGTEVRPVWDAGG
jgi:hypothetical protein